MIKVCALGRTFQVDNNLDDDCETAKIITAQAEKSDGVHCPCCGRFYTDRVNKQVIESNDACLSCDHNAGDVDHAAE